jgi:hypothetical protein
MGGAFALYSYNKTPFFFSKFNLNIIMDLITALSANSYVNKVQQATIREAVFSVDPTEALLDGLDSDHVICVYCRSISVPRLSI